MKRRAYYTQQSAVNGLKGRPRFQSSLAGIYVYDLVLSKIIANFPLPVLTGIGHEIDESIADLVAYKALKTPTAVAEWLIQYNMYFEMALLELGSEIQSLANRKSINFNESIRKTKNEILNQNNLSWQEMIQSKD